MTDTRLPGQLIDIRDGELFDLLRFTPFADDVDAKCFSYALKCGLQFVLDRLVRVQTHSDIDAQPEATLDALAGEFRAPYYDQTLPVEVKQNLAKTAIVWHYHGGTPSAVQGLIDVVLGSGAVVEWFDFEDPPFTPFTFAIETSAQILEDSRQKILGMIHRVKNTRSHLRRLIYKHPPIDVDLTFSIEAASLTEGHISEIDKNLDYGHGPFVYVDGQRVDLSALPEVDKNTDYSKGPHIDVDVTFLREGHLPEVDKNTDYSNGPHIDVDVTFLREGYLPEVDKNADYGNGPNVGVETASLTEGYLPEVDKNTDYGNGPHIDIGVTFLREGHLPEVDKNADYSRGPDVTASGNRVDTEALPEVDKNADYKRGVFTAAHADSVSKDALVEVDKNADYKRGVRTRVRGGMIEVNHLKNLDE